MKKFLRMWLIVPGMIAVIALSCTKNDKGEENAAPDPAVSGAGIAAGTKSCLATKIVYGAGNGDYELIEYDTQNRPVKLTYYNNGTFDGYQKISWNGSDITQEYYNDQNVKEDVYTYKTGSNGYISNISNLYSYTSGGFTYNVNDSYVLTQNAEGYLTKVVDTETITSNQPGFVTRTNTYTTTNTYSGGNLVSSSEASSTGNTSTDTYEYYTDKPGNIPGSDDEILDYLTGKRSTNLLKKETYSSAGGSSSSTTYTYTFNPDGLISKQTANYGSGSSYWSFEYSCK